MPVGKGSIARATNASNKTNASSKTNASNKAIVNKTDAPKVKLQLQIPEVLTNIPVSQIDFIPVHWRKDSGNTPTQKLLDSIKKFGIIEPVILRRLDDSRFQLLSGNRRLQAVKDIGMEFIAARVIEGLSDKEAKELIGDLHTGSQMNPENIHEYKFKAVSSVSNELPTYLL